jgi:DNA-binding response OmpR family regulator
MNKCILLIDDTEILAHSISDLLSMEGFHVIIANNGLQGIAIFNKEYPDLVLTDLVMPGMNGFQVIRHIRGGDRMNRTPIIILTADTNPENEDEARIAGANLLLHKPFDEDNLISAIKKLLQP